MWRFALALAYLSSTAMVSPCLATPATLKRKASREATIEQFVERLKRDGEVTQFHPVLVKLMDFPENSTKRSFEAPAPETTDTTNRLANIVFSKAPSSDDIVAVGLYWVTMLNAGRSSTKYHYNTAVDGTLRKAARIDGQLDESGKTVRGGGKLTELNVEAEWVRDRFQREVLDFWLKGKGRKKAASRAPKE